MGGEPGPAARGDNTCGLGDRISQFLGLDVDEGVEGHNPRDRGIPKGQRAHVRLRQAGCSGSGWVLSEHLQGQVDPDHTETEARQVPAYLTRAAPEIDDHGSGGQVLGEPAQELPVERLLIKFVFEPVVVVPGDDVVRGTCAPHL